MSYWERDPYRSEMSEKEDDSSKRQRSELAQKAFDAMFAVARNENLEVLGFEDLERPCINTGATTYQYDPRRPEIVVCISQPWPQVRWSFAVALGHHFTRHHFYQLSDRAVWRQQAEQWAISFLAANTAENSRYPGCLPDNTEREPVRRPEEPPEPPGRPTKFRVTCKATRPNGKPCRNHPTPGTPFCRHHQEQSLFTLTDIVGWLRGGNHE